MPNVISLNTRAALEAFAPLEPEAAELPIEEPLERMDLNRTLLKSPHSTVFFRVSDEEGRPSLGIYPGDILIVDSSEQIVDGSVIIAVLDLDEPTMTVGVIHFLKHGYSLQLKHKRIRFDRKNAWGRVTYTIHPMTAEDRI